MKRQHLLRVDRRPPAFAEIFRRLGEEGMRCGWLDWGGPSPTPPPPLEEAVALGALRAVAVGGGRTLALKALKGEPVLVDLQREHFRGCALVLVHGEARAPLLEPVADGWQIVGDDGAKTFSLEELVARLRSPLALGEGGPD